MLGVAGFTASAPDAFISRPSADGARDAALGIRFPPAGSKGSKIRICYDNCHRSLDKHLINYGRWVTTTITQRGMLSIH